MNETSTLIEFLEQSDIRVQAFDLGRRIRKLPRQQLLDFEQRTRSYPFPFLQHAWLGLLLSDRRPGSEPLIWFLKFPLDNEGKLVSASRDDFLLRIIKTVGERLELGSDDPGQDALKETPYAFKPEQERMACFHARALRQLGSEPSAYYATAHDYFSAETDFDNWQKLGLQGIADLCVRLDKDDNARHLSNAIAKLPIVPLEILCCCLEHEVIEHRLTAAIADRGRALIAEHSGLTLDPSLSPALIGALLRGLSASKAEGVRQAFIDELLTGPLSNEVEILSAIASRCWSDLDNPQRLHQFLEQLATNAAGQDCFNRVILDLLSIPGMAEQLMSQFRNPERSEALGIAIGAFLSLAS